MIFINYEKMLDENALNYINNTIIKFNMKITNEQKFYITLNKPAKNHGHCVKSYKIAYANYYNDLNTIKNIVQANDNLNKYVNNDIIDYFEHTSTIL